MNIAFLTPGTGSYYCGACMRDNALAKSLLAAGHEVSLLPMYLPMQLDEAENAPQTDIFFGGINVYLQQKLPFFRRSPAWLDQLFNATGLLRAAARRSHMTSPREHGEMALAMLEIESSPFAKETEKLLQWLERHRPDLVVLSNALLAGFTATLRRRLDCKIIACFQGEDGFLDGLPEPFRTRCWDAMRDRLAEADQLIAPSRFYADLMRERLGAPDLPIAVMPNGTEPAAEPPPAPSAEPPTIGYLARMIPEKGLELLVDAFIHLRRDLGHPDARLHIAGSDGDHKLVADLKRRIDAAGLTNDVTWSPNVSHAEKSALLSKLAIFTVPATYHEAFGLYTVEALAAGVPLVLPRSSSFPEIVESHDCGRLVEPADPVALATAWRTLLGEPEALAVYRENALRASRESYSIEAMRERFLAIAEPLVSKSL